MTTIEFVAEAVALRPVCEFRSVLTRKNGGDTVIQTGGGGASGKSVKLNWYPSRILYYPVLSTRVQSLRPMPSAICCAVHMSSTSRRTLIGRRIHGA